MAKPDPVRLGIWGIGAHTQRTVLPALGKVDAIDVAAVFTRDRAVREEVAAVTGAISFGSAEELLAASDVDAIYVATPTGLHSVSAQAVVGAGKHLWCEKPMTTSLTETAAIVDAAVAQDVVALEVDMFLHHPQFVALKQFADSPEIGAVKSITARFGFPHREGDDFRYSAALGGGALLDAGFYPVAAAVGLLPPDLRLAGCNLEHDGSRGIDVGGTALVVSQDRVGVLDWGFGRSYRSEIEVWCEGAAIHANRAFSKPAALNTQVVVRHQSGEVETVDVAAADHFSLMFESFAAVSRGEVTFDPTPQLERARILTAIRTTAS